ncbi:DUF1254 domain-containing protein [Microbacterium candidum]|uniref:DUF1254 domain-containing protein n=1 Tax=Microbacterium candidum TaxID=3041922 RepID=A0ABT7MUC7_9MICO|nr:DUF1254 domain-containing protein [Microbacterium sp. ASV49]MDL9978051.1 DUF1254 domain-containing protein [Microbacterium sp. ASV49]
MNRLILKYGTPITVVILLIFAWVIASRLARGVEAIATLAIAAVIVWALGTVAFVLFWPRITINGFKRAIVKRGFGGGPIPVNTLYAESARSSASTSAGSVMATGTDDLLYIGGWIDVKASPLVLHVPDSAGRYYSVQFTDPATGANFAYVGTRATGTDAADTLLCAPEWPGRVPDGMTRIVIPHGSALVVGRVFAADDDDRADAHALAQQIRLMAYET